MSYEIYSFDDEPKENQQHIADTIVGYTTGSLGEQPQMLPVTADDVLSKHLGFCAQSEGEFAGFIGAIPPVEWHGKLLSEVGTLWVPAEHRKQGIAFSLVKAISAKLFEQEIVPYAFCNPKSAPIFKAAGYSVAKCSDLPSDAFNLCAKCPMKPPVGCCDEPVVYGGDK